MKIWIVAIGEPIPGDADDVRLHRAGTLATRLSERGHDVTWWTSSFNHFTKTNRFRETTSITKSPNLKIVALRAPGYPKNLSFRRFADHYLLSREFARCAREAPPPDAIYTAMPDMFLSHEAVRIGVATRAPTVVDVRDAWPDIFVDPVPSPLKPLASVVIRPLQFYLGRFLRKSAAIWAITPPDLEWSLAKAGFTGARDFDSVFYLGYPNPPQRTGVDSRETILSRYRISPNRVIAWFIGTFGSYYDLVTVADAARLANEDPSLRERVHFVLSGSGDSYPEIEKRGKDLPNLTLTGWINKSEISDLMSVADLGLAAYIAGAPHRMPNKYFEYMAAGLPILSSLRGEGRAFLTDNDIGSAYDAATPASLVEAIRKYAMDGSLLERQKQKSAETFRARFSEETIFGGMASALEALATRRSL